MESSYPFAGTKFSILITEVDQGGYTAECGQIPGCVSEGETLAETTHNIQSAVRSCVEVMAEDGRSPVQATQKQGRVR